MVLMRRNKFASPVIQTSVTLSPEFYNLARSNNIKFSEAMRVGISVILAEKGVKEYDNRLNIFRQLQDAKLKSVDYAKKVFELEEKLKKYEEVDNGSKSA